MEGTNYFNLEMYLLEMPSMFKWSNINSSLEVFVTT